MKAGLIEPGVCVCVCVNARWAGGEIRAHGENAVIYGGTSHSVVRTLEDGMMKNVRGFEIFPG